VRGLALAAAEGAQLVVLQMDTPGGLDTAMRDIIRAILAAPIPVATYVTPAGARAASAGTYILYASHVAAMAPATNLGAATPVAVRGEPPASPQPQPKPGGSAKDSEKPAGPEPGSALERKAVNDAVAYIRGLAQLRGRNVEWAELAVRSAASLPSQEALAQNVIDVVAQDLSDLLRQIDGRELRVETRTVKLAIRGAAIERVEPDWRTRVLSVLTNPTIAYGLLLVGIYGLLLEGYSPGAILPGVVGAIALIVALFAFQILDVNWAGLALIAVGVTMIIAEFFIASFGALGVGGLISFVVGSIILLDTDVPGLGIAWPLIAAVATAGALVVLAMGWLVGRSVRRPVVTGAQSMVGATAQVFEDFTGQGRVYVGGELWNARCAVPVSTGQAVRITKVEGLWVWVEPI
jgi:membrane-bound serine protease (ClpP class)